jgi:hypothetical protein
MAPMGPCKDLDGAPCGTGRGPPKGSLRFVMGPPKGSKGPYWGLFASFLGVEVRPQGTASRYGLKVRLQVPLGPLVFLSFLIYLIQQLDIVLLSWPPSAPLGLSRAPFLACRGPWGPKVPLEL